MGVSVRPRVLNAGSGLTFFPFLVAEHFPGIQVLCCDDDSSLAEPYRHVHHCVAAGVSFKIAGLETLPYPDGSQDAIYCVSVLEHTTSYRAILNEFARILRPGGTLIVTFNDSIDRLLRCLAKTVMLYQR